MKDSEFGKMYFSSTESEDDDDNEDDNDNENKDFEDDE